MPQVVISINGRNYTMECGEGQEDHLRRLARRVDEELARIRDMAGPVGEIRLLIMTALVIADKVAELEQTLESLKQETEQLRASGNPQQTEQVVLTLERATEKLQQFAAEGRRKGA